MDVEEKDGKVVIKGFIGIDNDLSFGSLSTEMAEEDYLTGSTESFIKPLEAGGESLLMGLDKQFADRVIALEPTQVTYLLKPFLNGEEISAALDRLKTVQQFLKNEASKYKKGEESLLIGEKEQEKWEAIRAEIDRRNPVGKETFEVSKAVRGLEKRGYIESFMVGWKRLTERKI